jgi:hypothetical protein
MNEKLLEKKLREQVKKLGGIALKFASASYTGMPDRIILMPGGKVQFVEVKSPGKKSTVRQEAVHRILREMDFKVSVISDQFELTTFLKTIEF